MLACQWSDLSGWLFVDQLNNLSSSPIQPSSAGNPTVDGNITSLPPDCSSFLIVGTNIPLFLITRQLDSVQRSTCASNACNYYAWNIIYSNKTSFHTNLSSNLVSSHLIQPIIPRYLCCHCHFLRDIYFELWPVCSLLPLSIVTPTIVALSPSRFLGFSHKQTNLWGEGRRGTDTKMPIFFGGFWFGC